MEQIVALMLRAHVVDEIRRHAEADVALGADVLRRQREGGERRRQEGGRHVGRRRGRQESGYLGWERVGGRCHGSGQAGVWKLHRLVVEELKKLE